MTRRAAILIASVLGLGLSMCAPEPPNAPSASPAVAPGGEPEMDRGIEAAPSPPPPVPAESPMEPAAAESANGVAVRRGLAIQTLERSERELRASIGDCARACRALASMERATAELCSLEGAEGPAGAPRCEDARQRLRSARDRVRLACGSCSNGPSVERDAPIPSR